MAYNPNAAGCNYTLPVRASADCELFNDELVTGLRIGYFGKPLLTPDPNPITNEVMIAARAQEWATRLNQTATRDAMANAIRRIAVENFILPPADQSTKTTAGGRTIGASITPREITGVIDDDSDASYAFWSAYAESPKTVLFWFESGPDIYGGVAGLEATVLASYKINTDGVSHSWNVRIAFNQRGTLPRTKLTV